ncbi:nitroreductase family protein [Sphingomonas baiyangensis]|uniref:Putative NAD(P)H nitroreductase n=1 Tax=Sphingomonas baiyangensis TaxID=2572576 RepID=A0A4U1L7K9_9SPHN|nr:nitroreductase [Sphingomonas baiyangensis]TKD52345.1 nitroreductase [Sphingomonas baiyangensis]
MFNDTRSLAAYLATRRSGRPKDMVAPGPDRATLDAMVAIAARTPDHGKLAPWRFVVIDAAARDALTTRLVEAYRADKPDAGRLEIAAIEQFAHQAPSLVVVLSSPRPESHIPLWEQELAAGAACMNLLHAAHAHGFVGGWLTGWAAYSDRVRNLFGSAPERIAGFMFIGTPGAELVERPRPDMAAIVSRWNG